MICPHCQKPIDDDASLCPHCHGYVRDPASPSPSEFVFCDGCGARLSPHDRTCPKCGRPAPGILSTRSSAPDLAAGKTASFPRLTKRMIEQGPRGRGRGVPPAPQAPAPGADPFATNVLPAADIASATAAGEGADPYHRPRRRLGRRLAIGLVAAALVGGGVYFAVADPLGVMPGYLESLRESASQMFPSRMAPETPEQTGDEPAADPEQSAEQDKAATDAQALPALTAAYKRIVAQHDALDTIIDDYNTVIFASNRDQRAEGAASAYGARDVLDQTIEDLEAMELPEGSAYTDELANLLELAGWVRTRVDMYCASWDIALSYTEGDLPSRHQDEILAPLRDRAAADAEARDNFFSHVAAFEPKPVTAA